MATAKPSSLLSATLASGSSLVLLQLFSRVVTFVLNQALVRIVSPQVFGTTSIQFELLLSTILFLSREGVRNALLRAPSSARSSLDQTATARLVANISLLSFLAEMAITARASLRRVWTICYVQASQPNAGFDLPV